MYPCLSDGAHNDRETNGAVYGGVILAVTETVSVLLFLFITNHIYRYLWGSIPATSFVQIIIAIIFVDFLYYVYHRAHHMHAKLYAIHRVHHSGTKYNLALAITLPWIGQASIYFMLIPLILLHFTPMAILGAYFFILTYQFFCHMAYLNIPKMCDVLLVTPRNHRVHHYNDRDSQSHNFGAVFSIWDRLFGTYKDKNNNEEESFGVAGYSPRSMLVMQKETIMQFSKKKYIK
jgi:sterol desaturase/sphingolipid hydroxylase (fatty acid hydroxylase superfamily)